MTMYNKAQSASLTSIEVAAESEMVEGGTRQLDAHAGKWETSIHLNFRTNVQFIIMYSINNLYVVFFSLCVN